MAEGNSKYNSYGGGGGNQKEKKEAYKCMILPASIVNPYSKTHGAPDDEERHVGDLGNFKTDSNGNAEGTITDKNVKLIGPTSVLGVCELPPNTQHPFHFFPQPSYLSEHQHSLFVLFYREKMEVC